jgi:hypothetical protein
MAIRTRTLTRAFITDFAFVCLTAQFRVQGPRFCNIKLFTNI